MRHGRVIGGRRGRYRRRGQRGRLLRTNVGAMGRRVPVLCATLCVSLSVCVADEGYSYPEYDKADEFSAPCGQWHSGSNTAVCRRMLSLSLSMRSRRTQSSVRAFSTSASHVAVPLCLCPSLPPSLRPQDVSDWARKKPWFTAVKAHMDEYKVRAPCHPPATYPAHTPPPVRSLLSPSLPPSLPVRAAASSLRLRVDLATAELTLRGDAYSGRSSEHRARSLRPAAGGMRSAHRPAMWNTARLTKLRSARKQA